MAKDINEMAEKLGIKKENLDAGLKADKKKMEEAIIEAHAFMHGKGK